MIEKADREVFRCGRGLNRVAQLRQYFGVLVTCCRTERPNSSGHSTRADHAPSEEFMLRQRTPYQFDLKPYDAKTAQMPPWQALAEETLLMRQS